VHYLPKFVFLKVVENVGLPWVRQKDLPHFKRQLQTNKERYGKNTLICEQQI
jgi:hypothetical protein